MFELSLKKLKRIKENIVPDILDNIRHKTPPRTIERTFEKPEDAMPLLERLCPENIRGPLRDLTQNLARDVRYRARALVGHAEDGTKHPHDFVIEKSEYDILVLLIITYAARTT